MSDDHRKGWRVVVQNWEESERGWGVRPDGFTLHIDNEERERYIKGFLQRQKDFYKNKGPDFVPDEYTRPSSHRTILVDDYVFAKVKEHGTVWGEGTSCHKDFPKVRE